MSRLKSVKLRFVRVFLTFSSFLISCCSPALPERIMWPTRVFSLFQIYQNQLCTQKKKSLQLMIWLCNSLWCCFTFRRLHFPGPLRTRCLHHMKFVLFFGIKCKCFKLSFVNETVSFFLFFFLFWWFILEWNRSLIPQRAKSFRVSLFSQLASARALKLWRLNTRGWVGMLWFLYSVSKE